MELEPDPYAGFSEGSGLSGLQQSFDGSFGAFGLRQWTDPSLLYEIRNWISNGAASCIFCSCA